MEGTIARLVADPYPPYQFEEEGKIRGVDQETIEEAFRLQGVRVQTVLLPWKECLRRLDQGGADGIFQIAPSEERRKLYLFSEILRTERTLLFARSGTRLTLRGGADLGERLAGRTLGVLEGYSYGPAVDGLAQPVNLVKLGSQEALLRALRDGKADLVLMDAGVASYLAGKTGVAGIEPVEGFTVERPLHVAFAMHRRDLAGLFNEGLREVKARALDRHIFDRYGGRP